MRRTIEDTKLTAIADAIREKGGTTEGMTVDEMPEAVLAIKSGGLSDELVQITNNYGDLICIINNNGEPCPVISGSAYESKIISVPKNTMLSYHAGNYQAPLFSPVGAVESLGYVLNGYFLVYRVLGNVTISKRSGGGN